MEWPATRKPGQLVGSICIIPLQAEDCSNDPPLRFSLVVFSNLSTFTFDVQVLFETTFHTLKLDVLRAHQQDIYIYIYVDCFCALQTLESATEQSI